MIFPVRVAGGGFARVTGEVLPVYVHPGWQIEEVLLDRGTGLRSWWEARHGGAVSYCASRAELDLWLHDHGLTLSRFAVLDTVDDGCE